MYLHVCIVCLSIRCLKTWCSQDHQTWHRHDPPWVLGTHLFWGQRSRLRGTNTLPLFWVLTSSNFCIVITGPPTHSVGGSIGEKPSVSNWKTWKPGKLRVGSGKRQGFDEKSGKKEGKVSEVCWFWKIASVELAHQRCHDNALYKFTFNDLLTYLFACLRYLCQAGVKVAPL